MSNKVDISIEMLLERLDLWRFFPKFQLERRFDALFSFLIPSFLANETKSTIDSIIPEFPIPKSCLKDAHYSNNDCINVDFLAIDKKEKKCFFIEFKTDEKSNRSCQDSDLNKLSNLCLVKIIKKILVMVTKSRTNQVKYLLLLKKLNELGWTNVHQEFFKKVILKKSYRNQFLLSENAVKKDNLNNLKEFSIDVIKIVPKIKNGADKNEFKTYNFGEFISLNSILGKYLCKWQLSPEEAVGEHIKQVADD